MSFLKRAAGFIAILFISSIGIAGSGDWPMLMHDAAHTGVNPDVPATLAPPVALRWVNDVKDAPNASVWLGGPSIRGGKVYLVPGWMVSQSMFGEIVETLDAGTGELLAVKRLNWGGFPPVWCVRKYFPFDGV